MDEHSTWRILRTFKTRILQNVEDLIRIGEKQSRNSKEEMLRSIFRLKKTGKIKLGKNETATKITFDFYLKTRPPFWYMLFLLITLTTVIMVFAISENHLPFVYLRYLLGSIYVLWLPGYAFTKAVFPAKSPIAETSSLDPIERIALSIGMSLTFTLIVGLFLNHTPWGIRLAPVTLSLMLITLILVTVALVREHDIRIGLDGTARSI